MIALQDIRLAYGTEIALVVLCCRIHFNTERIESLQPFINEHSPDWGQVLYLCDYHRIEPITHQILSQAKLPANIATKIRQRQMFLIQQNFRQAVETERIIQTLETHGISCVPYKGSAFSRQFYGDIISRESSDIDLVIFHPDFDKLIAVMEKEGYDIENRLEYDYFKQDIVKRAKELNFNRYKDGHREFHVEFHWQISDHVTKLSKQANSFFTLSTQEEVLAKEKLNMLDVNAHYLAVFIHHSNNDGFSVLRNLLDLAQLSTATHNSLDIDSIHQKLKAAHLTKAMNVGAYLISAILGINYPLGSGSNDFSVPTKVKSFFLSQLLDKDCLGAHFKIKPVRKNLLYLKDRTVDKISYLTACIGLRFTPSRKDIRTFNLPKRLYFLYYILKPFRSLLSPVSHQEEKDASQQQSR